MLHSLKTAVTAPQSSYIMICLETKSVEQLFNGKHVGTQNERLRQIHLTSFYCFLSIVQKNMFFYEAKPIKDHPTCV